LGLLETWALNQLNFGCGDNILLPPWENFDIETDIRKPLPMLTASADFILAEHLIEHVEFREGLSFLYECWRVLKVDGVLRLAFPDITREIPLEDFRAGVAKFTNRQLNCPEDVWLSILVDWTHKSCWTLEMAKRVLLAVGFEKVSARDYGYSPHPQLSGVDGHHLLAGLALARAETTVLEATR
jgi:hypothetical protein